MTQQRIVFPNETVKAPKLNGGEIVLIFKTKAKADAWTEDPTSAGKLTSVAPCAAVQVANAYGWTNLSPDALVAHICKQWGAKAHFTLA